MKGGYTNEEEDFSCTQGQGPDNDTHNKIRNNWRQRENKFVLLIQYQVEMEKLCMN